MEINIFLFGILAMTFAMVITKRVAALINAFCLQSLFLFLFTLFTAIAYPGFELYTVAGLLFVLKVVLIPHFLRRIVKKINADGNLGLFLNPVLSLLLAISLVYLAYLFWGRVMPPQSVAQGTAFVVSLSVTLIGLFLMIFRIKAMAQIIGLLVMENGLFLAGAAVSSGMPFFVEIAIFFDVMVCVIILGIFVYKINRLFTHIDVNKLTRLKG
jgi:hydrogenase-4 component E